MTEPTKLVIKLINACEMVIVELASNVELDGKLTDEIEKEIRKHREVIDLLKFKFYPEVFYLWFDHGYDCLKRVTSIFDMYKNIENDGAGDIYETVKSKIIQGEKHPSNSAMLTIMRTELRDYQDNQLIKLGEREIVESLRKTSLYNPVSLEDQIFTYKVNNRLWEEHNYNIYDAIREAEKHNLSCRTVLKQDNILDILETICTQFKDASIGQINQDKVVYRKNKKKEQNLELSLFTWLRTSGVEAERQVKTPKHRLDIWIPGKLMIELKSGKITANDICQAINYYSTYEKRILLIGKGLTNEASRGLEGLSKIIGDENIMFVSWGGSKPLLKSILNIA